MMKHIVPAAFAAAMLTISVPAIAKAPIEGRWVTAEKDAIIEIKQCGASICGRLIKFLVAPPTPNPKDANNPNPKLRGRTILGMPVLTSFNLDDPKKGEYKGQAYDPKSGKVYRAYLTSPDGKTLKVKGCLGSFGPLCETQTWRKAG